MVEGDPWPSAEVGVMAAQMAPDTQRMVAKGQGTTPSVRVVAARSAHRSVWEFGSEEGRHTASASIRQPSAPETVAADAIGEIKSLEAAIALLGENRVDSQPLLTALKRAQAKSKVPPEQQRVESCTAFLERANKRLSRAEEVISSAVEQKAIHEAEVAEASARLRQLEAEATAIPVGAAVSVAEELQERIYMFGAGERLLTSWSRFRESGPAVVFLVETRFPLPQSQTRKISKFG